MTPREKADEAIGRGCPRVRLWTALGRARVVNSVLDAVGYDSLLAERDRLAADLQSMSSQEVEVAAERDRYRGGLADAVDEMQDMLPYVPEWAREKWGYDESLARARAALQSDPAAGDGGEARG